VIRSAVTQSLFLRHGRKQPCQSMHVLGRTIMRRLRSTYEAELPLDAQQLYALAMDTSILLGWQVLSNDQSELRFRVPLSIFSWGENVFVTVDDGHIQAISESRVPLAMTDWGKNSSNLERFFNRIELVAAR